MLTNRSEVCGFTPLRRRTLNLTRLNHTQNWTFTTCVVIHTDFFALIFCIWTLSAMSTVLFSTTRPVPGRNVPQRSAETLLKLTGTCRNLFGPVDHDELKRELTSKLREISERDQLRWNFNFGEGRPLDGDLKWEDSPAEDCPEFYRERTAKRPFVDLKTSEGLSQIAPKCEVRSKMVLNQKKQTKKSNRRKLSRKTVQTKRLTDMRITDFYGKRKKTDSVYKESRNAE